MTNCHKLSSLKRHTFVISVCYLVASLGQEDGQGLGGSSAAGRLGGGEGPQGRRQSGLAPHHKAWLGRGPLSGSRGCRQSSVPCRLLDSGPQALLSVGQRLTCCVGVSPGQLTPWRLASSKPRRESNGKMEVRVNRRQHSHRSDISPFLYSVGWKQVFRLAHTQGSIFHKTVNIRIWGSLGVVLECVHHRQEERRGKPGRGNSMALGTVSSGGNACLGGCSSSVFGGVIGNENGPGTRIRGLWA